MKKAYEDCIVERDVWVDYKFQAHICTNEKDIGKSCVVQNVPVRRLTDGEVNLCRRYFKDQIHYDKVWLVNDRARSLGKKYKNTSIVRFPYVFLPALWSKDFSRDADVSAVANWIHEMTHVWQFSVGGAGFDRGNEEGDASTFDRENQQFVIGRYALDPKWIKRFCFHNSEQQGDLIALHYQMTVDQGFRVPRIGLWPLLEYAVEKDFLTGDRGVDFLPRKIAKPPLMQDGYFDLVKQAKIRWGIK
ncbi:hypothetical protein [Chromobacterium violaceum]|uniref:hypothetical protein n=1 Tax=Chromobacterium violaceum TaxID=536 RepID=UPI00111BD581|nr:hypothetical protein [Chromobacterium violaceum]